MDWIKDLREEMKTPEEKAREEREKQKQKQEQEDNETRQEFRAAFSVLLNEAEKAEHGLQLRRRVEAGTYFVLSREGRPEFCCSLVTNQHPKEWRLKFKSGAGEEELVYDDIQATVRLLKRELSPPHKLFQLMKKHVGSLVLKQG